MNIQKLCPGCMTHIEEIEKMNVCPYCGFHIKNPQIKPYHLPPYTLVGEGNDKRYMIGRAVGEGAFGITYLSYDIKLEMKVAIKEFYPNKYATRENTITKEVTLHNQEGINLEAMKNGAVYEARKLARLDKYDGIVEVKDYFMDNETSYIVMEYIEGEDLKDYLKRTGGKLSVEQTKRMMKPVIEALAYVHKVNIIHRDISPDNLMITKDGNMKLIDFGAAREAEAGEKTVMVKLGYAPIEQFSATGNQGPWTDVYALAGTFYHCITGRKPAQATDRISNDALIPPSQLGVAISPQEEAVLLRALAVRVTDRIQSMQEFGKQLYSDVPSTNVNARENMQVTSSAYESRNYSQGTMVQGPRAINVPTQQYPAKQKTSPVILIAAIVMGLAVLSVVGVVFLSVMKNKDTSVNNSDTYVEDRSEEQNREEKSDTQTSSVWAEGQLSGAKDLNEWRADSYEGIKVDNIVDLLNCWNAFEESEKTEAEEILEEMITTLQNEADRNINTYMQIDKDYASALQCILETQNNLRMLESYSVAAQYINVERYEEKYSNALMEYETYITNQVGNYVSISDELSVEKTFMEADRYLSGGAYQELKEQTYTLLTIKKISWHIQNGTNSAEIIAYINERLPRTGNNCWVVEYLDHFREVYRIETNGPLTMVAEINHISNGYIIPSSSTMDLSYSDLRHLSQYELYIAYFEIYARHGRIFADAAVNKHFQSYSWYKPTTDASSFYESCLNEHEKNNVATILAFQKEKGYR